MARQNPPHTATAQFYINTQDNKFLDHPGQTGWGYCVFGRVVEGMDVVDKIAGVATGAGQGKLLNGDSSLESTPYVDAPLGDCPVENVVITSVSRLP
jgi:cyclophilin family peptidyl-prolyl cis-trans isomerase